MKTLIIPDIHTKHLIAQAIIDSESPDELILLGDYFDDWGDTPEQNMSTAIWLKSMLDRPNTTCLMGNHDQSYLTPNSYCSGYTHAKYFTIRSILGSADIKKLKLTAMAQGYLCTHAGWDSRLDSRLGIDYPEDCALEDLFDGTPHPLLGISRRRGGFDPVGGLTWADWDELETGPEDKQICGHTEASSVRNRGDVWCIDTRLKHYAVIIDGKLEIRKVESV